MKWLNGLMSILLIGIVLSGRSVFAAVKINEFLVDPTQEIEIINTGSDSADISNWYLDDSGGASYFTISGNTIIYPNSCLVFTSDFNLNKSSADAVRFFNNTAAPTSSSAILIDSFSYKSSPGTGISYQRLPDGSDNWASASATLGSFNASKTNCIITPTPTPTPQPEVSESSTTTSYDSIFISEVMVNPEAGEKEWVEFYNGNGFNVSLVNWYLDDIENAGSSPKLFSLDIPAASYAVFDLPSSMFNNDGDSVRLIDSTRSVKDSFEYMGSEKSKTYGRISFSSDNFCLQEASKGMANTDCLVPNSSSSASTPTPVISQTANKKRVLTSLPQQKLGLNSNQNQSVGEVLGAESSQPIEQSNSLPAGRQGGTMTRSFSFISLSYSLLTIASIFIKMKIGL